MGRKAFGENNKADIAERTMSKTASELGGIDDPYERAVATSLLAMNLNLSYIADCMSRIVLLMEDSGGGA